MLRRLMAARQRLGLYAAKIVGLFGSFVRDVDTDPISLAMVEAIHRIGHVMGMKTIAEFVTSPSVKQKLAAIGVDYVQGYEIARPAPLITPERVLP